LRRIAFPLALGYITALIYELAGWIVKKPSIFNRHKFNEAKQSGWVADVTKARRILSFVAQYPLEKAIKETIDWYLDNNWL
jgi:nucleoside-diphosphate-sugar epimerase